MGSARCFTPTALGQLESCPANEVLQRNLTSSADAITMHTWSPGPAIAEKLQGLDAIPILEVCRQPTHGRYFRPAVAGEVFVLRSANAGLEILGALADMDAHRRRSYRDMFLVFQIGRHLSEHYARNFDTEASLSISRSRRPADDQRNVLPPCLGQTPDGSGSDWDVSRLLKEGRKTAHEFGVMNPAEDAQIIHGLFAAARRFPLEECYEALVRKALFAEVDIEPPDRDVAIEVETRLLESLDRRLKSASIDVFNRWCLSSRGTLVAQIARQKTRIGKLSKDDVRWAILELTWQSYEYVAQCMHRQMRSFQWLLADPLDENEQSLFDLMYGENDWLCRIPLVLLAERFALLQPCIVSLQRGEPIETVAPILRRLLWYYAWMVREAREADQRR